MITWPFDHNWASSYNVTWSFSTTVLVSQSGYEQRIANRSEPRRAITTSILEDGSNAQSFDRFLWTVQADTLQHIDPTNGNTSIVRFDESQTIEWHSARVATSTLVFTVEPGADTRTYNEPDAADIFGGRYVFPFPINWSSSRSDAISLPRRTADFERGRIAVTRPINFASRTESITMLQASKKETDRLIDFFVSTRGRQGEFWATSGLDDLTVLETVSSTIIVDGKDAATMFNADTVNAAVALVGSGGFVYHRKVTSAAIAGTTTLLQLDMNLPEGEAVRFCAWLRVSRFASDDLTINWLTSTVAQPQVQIVALPYAESEVTSMFDEGTQWLLDYYGGQFALDVILDPLLIVLNVKEPRFALEG